MGDSDTNVRDAFDQLFHRLKAYSSERIGADWPRLDS
jgi:hypothetical protein